MVVGLRVVTGVFALIALALPSISAANASAALHCEQGKGIERALGRAGFRVVASGGLESQQAMPVKLQVWQRDNRDWVITEAYMARNRTCVVRAGVRLHMLY